MKNAYIDRGDHYAIEPKFRGETLYALIDKEDLPRAQAVPNTWRVQPGRGYPYVYTTHHWTLVALHREILLAEDDEQVDHINHDGLDNRRANLRFVSGSLNALNLRRGLEGRGFSGVRGVRWRERRKRWFVVFAVDGKQRQYGSFKTLEAAKERAREVLLDLGAYIPGEAAPVASHHLSDPATNDLGPRVRAARPQPDPLRLAAEAWLREAPQQTRVTRAVREALVEPA